MNYSVHIMCNECGETHPLHINVELDHGPVKRKSIGHHYRGGELPSNILKLRGNSTPCPTTGNDTSQEDNYLVFLVPSE